MRYLRLAGFINLPQHSFPIVSAAHHLFAPNIVKNPPSALKPGHVPGLQDDDNAIPGPILVLCDAGGRAPMCCVTGSTNRWAILNGFGISLGDSIIGLQALSAAMQLGAITEKPLLIRKPGLRRMVDKLYPVAADFADIASLVENMQPAALLGQGFTKVVDIRDFAFDPGFRGVAMIDFFLDRLGLDPASVPPALKRNSWLAPRISPTPPVFGSGYALVCPASSMSMRDMPHDAHARVLAWLLARGWQVATQGRPPEALQDQVIHLPACATMAELCGQVAHAACVIATDTAMVHLADAFSVPTLAFFTTHRPEWRMRDYANCTAIHLQPEGLPEALEFVRGPADLAATQEAWSVRGADMAWIDGLLDRFAPQR